MVITAVTLFYQSSMPTIVGNVCDVSAENPQGWCYEDLPTAGFPLYFLSSSSSSLRDKLDIGDIWHPWRFLIDAAIFTAVITTTLSMVRYFRRKKGADVT